SMNASLVMACSAPGKPSGTGRAPAAITMLRPLIAWPSTWSVSGHLERVRAAEASHPVKGIDVLFGKTFLAPPWYGIGKSPPEGNQLFPVDAQVASNAAPMHPTRPIGRFGPAYQHLLGIATAQRAGSAE